MKPHFYLVSQYVRAVVGGVSEDEWRVRRLVRRRAESRRSGEWRSSSGFGRRGSVGGGRGCSGYERPEWRAAWHADPPPDLLDGLAPELHREPRSADIPDSYLEVRERRRVELAERHRVQFRQQMQSRVGARY